jgi:hypothetical protein
MKAYREHYIKTRQPTTPTKERKRRLLDRKGMWGNSKSKETSNQL